MSIDTFQMILNQMATAIDAYPANSLWIKVIPTIISVFNELIMFCDAREVEERLSALETKVEELEIDREQFINSVNELSYHDKYAFRNFLKSYCLETLPEVTDAMIYALIDFAIDQKSGIREEVCEILRQFNAIDIECMKRIKAVRDFRLNSKSSETVKLADKPTRFHVENFPKNDYLIIPEISSEKRKYIPIGFMHANALSSNLVKIMPNATLYHFGVLTSNVHMAWMRAVCGRLKSDYRYSKDIVYNNFPWCTPTEKQKEKIEQTAQAILDARALYPDSSLADLYDELTMPPELRKAHQQNDRAVMQAYGFSVKDMTESKCVAELMKLYQALVQQNK